MASGHLCREGAPALLNVITGGHHCKTGWLCCALINEGWAVLDLCTVYVMSYACADLGHTDTLAVWGQNYIFLRKKKKHPLILSRRSTMLSSGNAQCFQIWWHKISFFASSRDAVLWVANHSADQCWTLSPHSVWILVEEWNGNGWLSVCVCARGGGVLF